MMRTIFKGLVMFSLVLTYIAASFFIRLIPLSERKRRALLTKNSSFFARKALPVLGIDVTVHGREKLPARGKTRLIVSNHLSSLDILVLLALVPSVFITSVELKNRLLTGMIARCGGSIFVERRSVASLKKEISEVSRVLKEGLTVVVFPEGTTSNGERVMPFKNSLLDAAIKSAVKILPLCLRYRKVNSEDVTAENRDSVFYYGGATFARHAFKVLSLKSIEVEVFALETIAAHGQESRKHLAVAAHRAISAAYRH
jgi:1-acyl-sn-glycerol-3-phosphate acyltransferase